MILSTHFTLEELTRSDLAARLGLDNTPPVAYVSRLKALAERLEQVRSLLGVELTVTSGYRGEKLNARVPGSALHSAHTLGYAADFHVSDGSLGPFALCRAIARSTLVYDQIILEYNAWCHLSIDPRERHQQLTKQVGQDYKLGLSPN